MELMEIKMDLIPFDELLKDWEIRGMVVLSLLLQIILVVFGSLRKYIVSTWLRIVVWLAYLSADLPAIVALGNLAKGHQFEGCLTRDNITQAFWASLLLFHLGGPDTITAYAIQDKELWLRHLHRLVVKVGVAFYVFVRSWNDTELRYLVIPVFVAGIIKYGEKTFSLKYTTFKALKNSLRSVDARINQEGTQSNATERNNHLHQAYFLYRKSLYLFSNLFLDLTHLKESYELISAVRTKEAFGLIEIELGLIYDLFYTKAFIFYSSWGILLRLISFLSLVSALVTFSVPAIVHKGQFCETDIKITYLLIIGALFLEVYAISYFIISDWAMNFIFNSSTNPISRAIYFLHVYFSEGKRWSGSIAQYSLINSCLKTDNTPKFFKLFDMEEKMKHMYIDWKVVDHQLKDLIFKQLSDKGNRVIDDIHNSNLRSELLAQKGDGVLERMAHDSGSTVQFQDLADHIRRTVLELEFDHSLLIWHIATDLCYYNDTPNREHANDRSTEQRRISKCLSDYMLYLLVMRPTMLPKGIGDIDAKYQDACEEVRHYFPDKKSSSEACLELLQTSPAAIAHRITEAHAAAGARSVHPARASSKYMLIDGCELARKLKRLPAEKMWEMISEVWIEMLAFAASRCEWKEHAQQLRRGGELLTHVCLLMAHLGLSQQYHEPRIDGHEEGETI